MSSRNLNGLTVEGGAINCESIAREYDDSQVIGEAAKPDGLGTGSLPDKIASGIRWIKITVTYTFSLLCGWNLLLAVKIFQMALLRSAGAQLGGWFGS